MRTHSERKRKKLFESLTTISSFVGFTRIKQINERVFQMINPRTGEVQQFHSIEEANSWMDKRWKGEV